MSYPKPLSEKSISRLYNEAGITEKQIVFLRRFFTACANLYGVIMAEDAWDVYRELSSKTETVRLHRKDMYAALGVLRRELVPFYVFEADEVFSEEERTDKYRVIALRELISPGYGKFADMYCVMDNAGNKPFFVPPNLLDYVTMPENKYEHELLDMLGRMKCTLSEYEDDLGNKHQCKYKGKRLSDFSYIGNYEEFRLKRLRGEIEGCKGNGKKAAEYEAKLNSITAAQYLVDGLKRHSSVGNVLISHSIKYFFDNLNKMGVSFSGEKQVNTVIQAVDNMHNNQHLWCNHGWTPRELSAQMPSRGVPTMSFGPGIQQTFADGTMDKDEFISKLKEMGFVVTE